MAAITVLINVFYFVKVFPPLPLVLSDAGIYHDVKRMGATYQVTTEEEPPRWRALFGTFPVEHIQSGGKLYLYSAVFAPYRLTTQIVHRWEWRDPKNRQLASGRNDALHHSRWPRRRFSHLFPETRARSGRMACQYRDRRTGGGDRAGCDIPVESQAVPPAQGSGKNP